MTNNIAIFTYIDRKNRKKIERIAHLNHTNMSEIVRRMIEFCLEIYDKKELNKLINKHNKWLARNPHLNVNFNLQKGLKNG